MIKSVNIFFPAHIVIHIIMCPVQFQPAPHLNPAALFPAAGIFYTPSSGNISAIYAMFTRNNMLTNFIQYPALILSYDVFFNEYDKVLKNTDYFFIQKPEGYYFQFSII